MITRTYEAAHKNYARPFNKESSVDITAFMISNYPDLMEGQVITNIINRN